MATAPQSQGQQRKKMFRLSNDDDMKLLSEVIAINPYGGDTWNRWSTVAENFMAIKTDAVIDGRRCRERTQLLLSYFTSEDKEKLHKSGTDEEYTQKSQLLQEVLDLSTTTSMRKEKKSEDAAARAIRKRALENLKPGEEEETNPPQKVKRTTSHMITYLKEKTEAENEIQKKRLEIESKKLELEERQQSIEQEKFQLEKEERKSMIELIKSLINK